MRVAAFLASQDRFNRKYESWHIKMGDNGDIRPPRVKKQRRQLLAGGKEGADDKAASLGASLPGRHGRPRYLMRRDRTLSPKERHGRLGV